MNNIFVISQKLKNTYSLNKFLDNLKINKANVDKMPKFKQFLNITSIIIKFISSIIETFLFTLLFTVAFAFGYNYYKISSLEVSDIFVYIYLGWSIAKPLLSSTIFEFSDNNYYAIQFLKLDAKKYLLVNYYWNLLKSSVIDFLILLIYSLFMKIDLITCVMLIIFSAGINILIEALYITSYKKNIANSRKIKLILGCVCLAIGYVLPFFNIILSLEILKIGTVCAFIAGMLSILYISSFTDFYKMFKRDFNSRTSTFSLNSKIDNNNGKIYNSKIFKKNGCDFLDSIFINRNKRYFAIYKILYILVTLSVSAGVILNITTINTEVLIMFAGFLAGTNISLYTFNNATYFSKLFITCDYGMLHYKRYRSKEIINNLFWKRLKCLLKSFWIPTIISSLTIFYMYTLCYSTNYLLAFVLINIFFFIVMLSVNASSLWFYYTVQPFKCIQKNDKLELNMNGQMKMGIIFGINIVLLFIGNDNSIFQYILWESLIYLITFVFYVYQIKTKAVKKFKIKL